MEKIILKVNELTNNNYSKLIKIKKVKGKCILLVALSYGESIYMSYYNKNYYYIDYEKNIYNFK